MNFGITIFPTVTHLFFSQPLTNQNQLLVIGLLDSDEKKWVLIIVKGYSIYTSVCAHKLSDMTPLAQLLDLEPQILTVFLQLITISCTHALSTLASPKVQRIQKMSLSIRKHAVQFIMNADFHKELQKLSMLKHF